MKVSKLLLLGSFLLGISSIYAQEKTSLKLEDAINLAISKSNEVTLANTKVETKKYELQTVKNNQYPSLKASGQALKLTNANIDMKSKSNDTDPTAEPAASPKVNQLLLGQLNANMPIFSGFKLKNSIKASENLYKAESSLAANTKEEIAMKVVDYYADLYKAQKSIDLLNENLKSANQRVTDFTAMEQNGIIARNDLLKAQLQVSKVQLSLDEANKNVSVINYYLTTLLKLSPETLIIVNENDFRNFKMPNVPKDEQEALSNRKDLEALHFEQEASEANVKVAKSAYYPTLNLVAGYTALNLQNVVTVQNAMNIGVGLSYDLTSIFKNSKEVKAAKSRAQEVKSSTDILTDNIKNQVKQATEDYNLALKQDLVYAQSVEQATENYRIVKDKYDNGLSDTNDLLEADVEQLNSKINQAYTKANIIEKYYELLSVSGKLTQSFNTKN